VDELIPAEYRQESELKSYVHVTDTEESWLALRKAWLYDEFVLDPNRLTLHIGKVRLRVPHTPHTPHTHKLTLFPID
jgi:hypothetical protein